MNIVFFAHPSFMVSQSMPRFTKMLSKGMKERGHTIEIWAPIARFSHLNVPAFYRKWLSYIDSYILFPQEIRKRLTQCSSDTLFVITDNALGPWIPLISNRPHVIHCHDFLAQRSALGEIPENPTSWTGQHYQAFIRRGFSQGHNFISISATTQHDLHRMLEREPAISKIVYNGLVDAFAPATNIPKQRHELQRELAINLSDGFLLHVGGNQWYKNREGIIRLYSAWRASSTRQLPLLLAGEAPSESVLRTYRQSNAKEEIHFLTGATDILIKKLYQSASLLLFPSLAEGFGWPIIEAMASGCPVITTDEAPMTEVSGQAAFQIPRLTSEENAKDWAANAAGVINQVLGLSTIERNEVIAAGLLNAQRFDSAAHLDRIEQIYQTILNNYSLTDRVGLTALND